MTSAVEILKTEDKTTGDVDAFGSAYLANPDAAAAYDFSERVCGWGRGQRVWANLNRHNDAKALAELLHAWLSSVPAARTADQATQIQPLMADMISQLERLGTALRDYQDRLRSGKKEG